MTTRRRGFALLGFLLLVSLTLPALARRVAVTTDDGRTFRGQLVSQDKQKIVINIAGVKTPFSRAHIAKIKELPTLAQQYKTRRAKLQDNDLTGRYNLALFLYEHNGNALAMKELKSLHRRFPKSQKVVILMRMVASQIAAAHAATQPRQTTTRWPVPLNKRLTDKQIDRIKVYEIDLAEHPRVLIRPSTINQFLRQYAGRKGIPDTPRARDSFRALPGYQQLAVMFHARARNFYGQVHVPADPPALRSFRSHIQTAYVLNYCGTARCHGGTNPAAQPLYLFRAQPNSARTVYTNFYILNQYTSKRGKMINRKNPSNSLLLQYGLPVNDARVPHPKTPGWHPYFSAPGTARFNDVRKFIGALYTPTPNYGIKYHMPIPARPAAASQPATQPTRGRK